MRFFIFYHFNPCKFCAGFLLSNKGKNQMQLTLIKNPDESKIVLYKIARIIYAETGMSSLGTVEALASMIANICTKEKRDFENIAKDKNIFDSLNKNSVRHKDLQINADDKNFKICLRATQKMLNGLLPDSANGAVRFHHTDCMPDWAVSKGYITEIDNLLFYL